MSNRTIAAPIPLIILLFLAIAPVQAAIFTVTTTADSGAGTLRQAILDANASAGADTINFNIIGSGVKTISPTSALPTITDSVTIDGYTQPGASANTLTIGSNATLLIVVNGLSAGSTTFGIKITASNCVIRGLVINNFSYAGIEIDGGGSNTIAGCFIGTNAAGTSAVPNGRGTMWDGICIGESASSSNNTFGGPNAADRNVISGNNGGGIWMVASGGGNTIQNDYIGVNAAGTGLIANVQHGIILSGSGNILKNNVVSGNGGGGYQGVYLPSGAGNTTIQGNIIGLNVAGTAAIPNQCSGLYIESPSNVIGGTAAGVGNVISGNGEYGIWIANASGNVIQGNYLGTNAAGTAAIANGNDGIGLSGCTNTTVGGTITAARNIISGNSNVSNNADGIWITGGSANTVQGNYIGTDVTGAVAIPNYHSGITIKSSQSNLIGGTTTGAGNLIARNTGKGLILNSSSRKNGIYGNSIHSNGSIGIDLGDNGKTDNNGTKTSTKANNDMDFPILTSARLIGTTLTIAGYVGSAAGQSTFASARVEIFKSDVDASGNGEGQVYLGFLTADAGGNFSGSLAVSGLASVDKITATASDATNNTSEFGPNYPITTSVKIIKWREVPNTSG